MRIGGALIFISIVSLSLAPASGYAAKADPSGFRFQSPLFYVHERDGAASITVQRSNASSAAQVRYISIGATAVSPEDYTAVKAVLDFAAGQTSTTFTVPIVDHGVPGLHRTIKLSLFGPSPIGLGSPSTAVLTIINDDPAIARDPVNPLGLPTAPITGNPMTGAHFFVDRLAEPRQQAAHLRYRHPGWARLLGTIGYQPGTRRFGAWDGLDPSLRVSNYLERAAFEAPGTVPMIATYRIVDGHCGNYSDPPSERAAYLKWITGLAYGIGSYRAVLFLEMDSLITAGCLSKHGLQVRMSELRNAINVLTASCPRLVIYLDAGAADAVSARKTARLLLDAGVAKIRGFFLNSTHFDWTSHEIKYGKAISRMTGGKHFVVNTGENGRGPLVPSDPVHHGNEVLCNPPGRGLGPRPTASTGYPSVDAFAWTSNPGESGGACVLGAPTTGMYWPAYAIGLIQRANFRVR